MGDIGWFVIKVALVVTLIRSFIIAPYNIPSESMMPTLLVGDYLLVTKYDYGWSRYSLPFGVPLMSGRIMQRLPARGDVVVFAVPEEGGRAVIKRVIGLPGDRVQMVAGRLLLNGSEIPKIPTDPLITEPTPGQPCTASSIPLSASQCAFPRFSETLPGDVRYDVLDTGTTPQDNTPIYTVPPAELFVMGDNRDNSGDSRFATSIGGVGMVPLENVIGRARRLFFSWDNTADWIHKIRYERIG
ncbi:MAG: signal peptidase I, partial [Alphaproteobacteria bacterium]|nr:signal peptidase I [Alphaproteobacteria bacterium]